MGQIDEQRDRKRLAELYAGMEKGELEEIAGEADSLTPVAREALRSEMLSRGMEAPPANAGAAETSRTLLEKNIPEKLEVTGVGEYAQPPCPKCGSLDVSLDGLDKQIAYTGFFLSVPIHVNHKGGKCHACGHEWEPGSETSPA